MPQESLVKEMSKKRSIPLLVFLAKGVMRPEAAGKKVPSEAAFRELASAAPFRLHVGTIALPPPYLSHPHNRLERQSKPLSRGGKRGRANISKSSPTASGANHTRPPLAKLAETLALTSK
jgi:hypothetical protein